MISKFKILILSIIFIGMFVNSIPIMELGAILLVGVITFDLLTKDSEIMPIGLIALCISGFQWLISPILTYHSPFIL